MSVLLSYYDRGQRLISHFPASWADQQSLSDSSNCSIVGEIVVGRVTIQFFSDRVNESLASLTAMRTDIGDQSPQPQAALVRVACDVDGTRVTALIRRSAATALHDADTLSTTPNSPSAAGGPRKSAANPAAQVGKQKPR